MAKYFSVKKNTNKTLTVSKTDYTTYTEIINISADTVKNITLQPAFTPETVTFNYTGAVQTYTVPQGVTKLIVDCVGAAGGGGIKLNSSLLSGGNGGRVQCKLSVTEGQTLNIYVGGKGIDGKILSSNGSEMHDGGYNGGGKGISHYLSSMTTICGGAGSGGGASDIRIGGTSLSDRIIVAGAGGGTGSQTTGKGGAGGGLIGMDGSPSMTSSSSSYTNSTGGTQSGGGSGAKMGSSTQGDDGDLGVGGNGYLQFQSYGAGGGGGYYGGGGGCLSGGAGGSSYTDPNLCTDVVHTQDYSEATGNGWIVITTSNS